MTSSGSWCQNGPGLLTPSPGLFPPCSDDLLRPHPSPPAKNLPCVQTHLAQLPAPSSHPSWGDPPLQRFQGWGEKRERAGQIRWEQQRERDGADDKREGRGSQADRAKPETRGAESEAQAEHQSLRETERWMELGVPPGRGSGGGGVGGEGVSELASFRTGSYVRAGEDPLIMQMAPGVPTEGHLLCALWAAASRLQRQAWLQRLLQTQPGPLPHPLPVSQPSRPDPSSSAPQSPEEAWR